ncbi:MAG TPA: NADH-quinone oxidoreductase subunit L [Thermoplasmataceae archaeon]|nr:NADH-quinone oxidoreductase subunit L [Thermoplasmataceae archaeon]
MFIWAWLIFIFPLIGFVLSWSIGRYRKMLGGVIASFMVGLSLLASYETFLYVNSLGHPLYQSYQWFYNIKIGVYVDHLTLIMVLMVSLVSTIIHLFTMYYMKGDPGRHVFFAETSLFTAGMLGLVVSSNLVVFFLFWELVGLCSYLLIGFWFFKPNATAAAKKAFIVTRVGDLLFLIGMAVIYNALVGYPGLGGNSPLSIPFLINNASSIASYMGATNLGIAAVLLLGGAAGKSSQFPLHVWIPDAMEGPTPVSALIHAATMVTAGVYLVARTYNIFFYSAPFAMYSVAIIGAFTALFAGTLGIVVNDLKRILAYSTISQLGYMMAAIGLAPVIGAAGISFGMFHLVIHAMFKALLFLTAGAILISLMDLRDVRQMGGLWRKMPVTITLFLIGSIALAAIPPTSGFYSKDTIISASWLYFSHYGSFQAFLPWLFLSLGALLTVLYTFRMFFLVAVGKPRSHLAEHAKEAPIIALIPLFILAFFSLFGGYLFQVPFYNYLATGVTLPSIPAYIEDIPLIYVAIGFLVALYLYGTSRWKSIDLSRNFFYNLLKWKYYMDVLYTRIIAERIILPVSAAFSTVENSYNSGVDRTGSGALSFGTLLRRMQDGVVENYFIVLIIGISIVFLLVELFKVVI